MGKISIYYLSYWTGGLKPFDLESGVRVTCDVGYFCANFGLPRLLCSRLRPNVRDRQSVRHHHHHHIYFRLPERPQKPIELATIKQHKENCKNKKIQKSNKK